MTPDKPDAAEPDAGSGNKAAPKQRPRRRTSTADPAPPEPQDAGRPALSRAQQAELRRKLRDKFH